MMTSNEILWDISKMGTLKPGATYVYERNGDEIYAREFGETDRKLIGYRYEMEGKPDPRTSDGRPLHEHLQESKLWGEIRRAAKTNPTLHDAIERVKLLYHLSKQNDKQT